jgi:hypothetical protein
VAVSLKVAQETADDFVGSHGGLPWRSSRFTRRAGNGGGGWARAFSAPSRLRCAGAGHPRPRLLASR